MISTFLGKLLSADQSVKTASGAFDGTLHSARTQIALARSASAAGDEDGFAAAFDGARASLAEARGYAASDWLRGVDLSGVSLPQLQSSAARLQTQMAGLSRALVVSPLPEYVAISRPVAVLHYPEAVPLAWSVAFAAEALPFVLLVVLVLTIRLNNARDDDDHDDWPPIYPPPTGAVLARVNGANYEPPLAAAGHAPAPPIPPVPPHVSQR